MSDTNFLEKYSEYQKSSALIVEAVKSFRETSRRTRDEIPLDAMRSASNDVKNFNPAKAHASGLALQSLADAHTRMAEALSNQSKCLIEATFAADDIIGGANVQG